MDAASEETNDSDGRRIGEAEHSDLNIKTFTPRSNADGPRLSGSDVGPDASPDSGPDDEPREMDGTIYSGHKREQCNPDGTARASAGGG